MTNTPDANRAPRVRPKPWYGWPVGWAKPAAPEDGAPAGKPKRTRHSVFGPAPGDRPDVLTDAETVVFPASSAGLATAPGQWTAPESSTLTTATGVATISSAEAGATDVADDAVADTDVAGDVSDAAGDDRRAETTGPAPVIQFGGPAQAPARHWPSRHWPARAWWRPAPRRGAGRLRGLPRWRLRPGALEVRRTRMHHGLLLCLLLMQAVLSLRLHNTAFEDEAFYLYSGHMELEHLLHGAALQGNYASYSSGAPVLYPVAAALVNNVGGLAAARGLSLVEMLATTSLLYSLTRRLFNDRVALAAAALFSVTESAIFLGHLATFDASCLFLLALAAWIVVRTAGTRGPAFLAAAPVAALAVGVKYAGLLFVPTIAVLAALAAWPYRGRWALLRPLAIGAAVSWLLYGALKLGGHNYLAAIQSTTTSRAQGGVPVSTILKESADWGGLLFVLAVIGAIGYAWRDRAAPGRQLTPRGGRAWRVMLGLLLTGTALLAPAYQAHLHTDISFQKHIGFGLFFAAPMAGAGLAQIFGDHFRRPQLGVGIWCLALVLGLAQSAHIFDEWPPAGGFVRSFASYLKPDAHYLVEVPEVPIYYLMGRSDAQPRQFTSTFNIAYVTKVGTTKETLTSNDGFAAAIEAGYFQIVAYNGVITPDTDGVIAQALSDSHKYYLASEVGFTFAGGSADYFIWVKGQAPTHHALAGTAPTRGGRS